MEKKMTKQEADFWARDVISTDIQTNISNGCYDLDNEDDPNRELKIEALKRLAKRIKPKDQTNA